MGFIKDTTVYMSNGMYKTLEDLGSVEGVHKVCSCAEKTKEFKGCNAFTKSIRKNAELVCVRYWIEYEAHSEMEIKCTPDQKFLAYDDSNNTVWIEAKNLKKGMYLVNDENDFDIVVYRDTEMLTEKSEVYSLVVGETNTFEIDLGIVVHT